MKHTKEEMQKAAQVLMKGCEERFNCEDCPFCETSPYVEDDTSCALGGCNPMDWGVDIEEEVHNA